METITVTPDAVRVAVESAVKAEFKWTECQGFAEGAAPQIAADVLERPGDYWGA
jgi:hypothetical protein